MPEYSWEATAATQYMCSWCGAVVANIEIHERFHKFIAEPCNASERTAIDPV